MGFLFLWGYSYFVYWFVFVGWFGLGFSDFFGDRDGVSPVIGVVLLVAITVIMATIVAGFVFEVIQEPNSSPLVELSIRGVDDRDNIFYVEHVTGDSIADVSSNLILYCQNSKLNENATLTVSGNNQDLDPGETLKVKVTNSTETGQIIIVEDSSNTILKATNNKFKYHQNQPPKTTNPIPSHKETDVSTNTDLAVKVTDPNNDKINTSFYWSNNTLIESVNNVDTGSKAITSNLNLQQGKTYSWYAVADDGQKTNKSNTWTFTTTTKETNSNPSADYDYSPTDPLTDESISFDGTLSSDSDGSISTYEWDWTSDGTYESTGSNPSHSYPDDGNYDVTLRVTDDDGVTDTYTETVTVENRNPSASLSVESPVLTDEDSLMDATGSSDPDGSVEEYAFDFTNDGTYEVTGNTDGTVEHSYPDNGTYTVKVRVTDNDRATDTDTATITVQDTDGGDNTAPNVTINSAIYQNNNEEVEVNFTASDLDNNLDNYTIKVYNKKDKLKETDEGKLSSSGETKTVIIGGLPSNKKPFTVNVSVTDDVGLSDTANQQSLR
ncbi:MAG: Secreted protein with PKD repeat domain [Candidatus Methanohalarchaeum thermophilum]|uniref:Secreted protein with PKD repeat domain n=1 Tax=Methanohalarchaeum thermophilum TaxID=1903181 RepID=A0A1Q6DWP4_METT1|nr:MAG: Secreted protein with PKD repeat domain [Candidatus Methanohalarchaeum thermophilum]